ncbi:hypothetical protein TIMSHEL_86 [Mycobacterium phage Timshel]|uniref:Uncharacterized protein n=1 Tax=Mycobacterium phage Timshel TaxID=1032895 RepID=G1DBA4_9CAUD|nr:hypothetical protein FDI10_gp08 [Mycobacterium phage Timshel]AEJ92348.1 hypothetical protein TIMSHEL_86 [Mycobacterium phage Timshel]
MAQDITQADITRHIAAQAEKAAAYDALMAELCEVTSHLAAYADSYEREYARSDNDMWAHGKAQAYRVSYDKVYAVLTAAQRGEL